MASRRNGAVPSVPISPQQLLLVVAASVLLEAITQAAGVNPPQQPKTTPTPAFEVVSVKPAGPAVTIGRPGEKSYGRFRPFRYTDRSVTATASLKGIIQQAYSLEDWAVEGPPWYNDELYEIKAVMPPNTSKADARLMLQTMLAERFGLKSHREKREIPVYEMVVGKRGFRLAPATEGAKLFAEMNENTFRATGTIDSLTGPFRRYADKPIVNRTGVEGIYHIELEWTAPDSPSRYDAGFWQALERRTGLKLESTKALRDVIVVDHAERVPTPN